MRAKLAALSLLLVLAGCGQRGSLEPKPGQALPPPPYGREQPMTVDRLLEPGPQAMPARNVELRRRSEERADDPFDLPPREDRAREDEPAGQPPLR